MTTFGAYPPPRYHGQGGEVTARFRGADEPPDLVLGPTQVHYLATGATTDGLFGLYRWEMDGSPGGAAPHFHRSFSESFAILSGTMRVHDGTQWVDATAGDFVHVPPGGIHGYANESGEPASMLLLFSPGAPREQYFEGLPRLGSLGPEERDAFLRHHDNLYLEG